MAHKHSHDSKKRDRIKKLNPRGNKDGGRTSRRKRNTSKFLAGNAKPTRP
jgi:hypothetical protein